MNPLPAATELAGMARLAARRLANPEARRPGTRSVRGRSGAGQEYREQRDFRPGDELRFVDWRLSARRQKLIVRQTQSESAGDWWLCLDGSASMRAAGGAKWRTAVQCAASLAFALLDMGYRVGLIVFAERILAQTPCGRGHAQFARLARQLRELSPRVNGGGSQPAVCAAAMRSGASGFLLSDFLGMSAIRRDLAVLRARCVALHALRVTAAVDLQLPLGRHLSLVDRETREQVDVIPNRALLQVAATRFVERSAELQSHCASQYIHYTSGEARSGWRALLIAHLLREQTS